MSYDRRSTVSCALCHARKESMLQVGEYLDILKAKKSAKEACSAFFCYAVAVRAKYLQLLLLYYRFTSHPCASSWLPPQLQPRPTKSSAGDPGFQLWCLADGKEVNMHPQWAHFLSFSTNFFENYIPDSVTNLLTSRFQDIAGTKRMTPYLAPFIERVCWLFC